MANTPEEIRIDPPEFSAEELARIARAFEDAAGSAVQVLTAFAPALAQLSVAFQRILTQFDASLKEVASARSARIIKSGQGEWDGAHRRRDLCEEGNCSHVRAEDCLTPRRDDGQ